MTETAQQKLQSEVSGRLEGIGSKIAVPGISIILAFIVGAAILLFMAADPITSFYYMTVGTLTPTKIADTLLNATPLLFTGLSVAVAFRGGMFNIGTEGQMIFGGFCSALVGFGLKLYFGITLPAIVMIPLLLLAGMVGGALWATIPAILKAKRGVHEVITTIMLNYIALTLVVFLVGDLASPFIDKNYGSGNASPQTPKISQSGWIETVANSFIRTFLAFIVEPFKNSRFHWGFFIGIIACFIVYIILWRTKFGYETRAVGYNPSAGKYGGINVANTTIKVMMVSGALGGIAGAIEVMAVWMRFVNGFSSGYGFDGIAVSLIGGNHPIGVIFGAILLGWLKSGGQVLQIKGTSKDLASALKGLIVFFVAVPLIAKSVISHFNNNEHYTRYSTNLKMIDVNQQSSIKILIRKGSIFASFMIDVITTDIRHFLTKLKKNFRSIITITSIMILVFLITSGIIFIAPILQQFGDEFFSPISAFLSSYAFVKPINDFFSSIFSIGTFLFGIAVILAIFAYNFSRQRGHKKIVQYFILLTIAILGLMFVLNAVTKFGQVIALLLFFGVVFFFILFQELQARKSGAKERADFSAIQITVRERRAVIIHTVFLVILLVFLGLIIYFSPGIIPLPISLGTLILLPEPYDFFFFTLENLGALVATIAVIFIICSFLILSRYELPRRNRLSTIFKALSLIIVFISVAAIFKLNSTLLFTMTLSIATPIGLASLGGMFSEKSGVVNIGLEGMMLTGCFVSVWISYETGDPWAGVIGAIIAGGLMGLLHAIASIKFRADQVVVGVAINLLATALTTLGLIAVWNVRGTSPPVTGLSNIRLPELVNIPIVGQFLYELSGSASGLSPLVYIFIIIIFISGWVIQKTSFGLRVRAVGEHPRAADTLGINVFMIRYICVILSGVLAALGGAQLTLGTVPLFGKGMTTGRGFVALAALIFGSWNPIGAALASLLFGFAYAFRFQLDAIGGSWLLEIPTLELILLICIVIFLVLIVGFIIIKAAKIIHKSELLNKISTGLIFTLPVVLLIAGVSQLFIIVGVDLSLEKLTPTLPFLITIIAVATVAKRAKAPAADGVPYVKEG